MKSSLITCLVLAGSVLVCASVRADLTILQELSSSGSSQPAMSTTTKWKVDKIRLDAGSTVSMILDSKNGGMVTLMHAQKVAVPVSPAIQKMAAQMAAGSDPKSTAKFAATGRKETLIGFPCEEFAGTISGQKATIWVTKEVPEYKELSQQLLSAAPSLKQYQGQMAGNSEIQGFPLLTEITSADGKKTTMRVLAVSREPLADSIFQIPDGYKKMELPQMPGMPAAK